MATKKTSKRTTAAKKSPAAKSARRRARFTAEDKRKVVTEAFPSRGKPRVKTVADKHKIPPAYIYRWRQQLEKKSSTPASAPRSTQAILDSAQQRKDFLEAEINRLLAEIKEIENALEI